MTTTSAIAALLGVGVGVGLLVLVAGWRGVEAARPRRRWAGSSALVTGDRRRLARCAGAVGVAAAAGMFTGWVVGALLVGVACWTLPQVFRRDRGHGQRLARIEAIASWTEMLRDTLSGAAGLEQTILVTAPLAPAAIRVEVAELEHRLRRGERLAPSLRALAERLADPTADLVIASLSLAAQRQARQLGDLLGTLAQVARDQAALRMRVAAGRARTRTSVRVITVTTTTMALALVALNRPYLAAYDNATGQLVLLVIGVLFAAGYRWLTRIAAFTEPPRILHPDNAATTGTHDRADVTPW